MFHELRMYKSATNRLATIENRMRDDLPRMLRKHGFPEPVGQWSALAGAGLPLYAWMLPWQSLEQRFACFGALYADPAWDEVRVRTNGDRDSVTEQRILFMRPLDAMQAARSRAGSYRTGADRLWELRLQRVQYGQLPAAAAFLRDHMLPALAGCGGQLEGAFEVFSGAAVFTVAQFYSWSSLEQRDTVDADVHALLREDRREQVRRWGNTLLQDYDSWLLRPMPFGTPQACFGQ